MSEVTGSPEAVTGPVTVPAVAAAPKTAIQIIESELANFFKQREQAIANVHAVDGAIQGAQRLLAVLKTEESKAVAAVKGVVAEGEKLVAEGVQSVEKVITLVKEKL